MFYEDINNFSIRTASDQILCAKAFNIAKNAKHGGYQREIALVIYNGFYKKSLQVVLSYLQIK